MLNYKTQGMLIFQKSDLRIMCEISYGEATIVSMWNWDVAIGWIILKARYYNAVRELSKVMDGANKAAL